MSDANLNRINEINRIQALKSYGILDTLAEEEYDELTLLAAQICDAPISLVSLIDENRQWFKSKQGLDGFGNETDRSISFCTHAIDNPEQPFIIEDAREDNRFKSNPLVTNKPNVVFYAGVPLMNSENYALGTLCVIDHKPRNLSANQLTALKTLAKSVVRLIETRELHSSTLHQNKLLSDALELNNAFYLIINRAGIITQFGSNFKKVVPSLFLNDSFSKHFVLDKNMDVTEFFSLDERLLNKLFFFNSLEIKQRFKSTFKCFDDSLIVSCNPIINAEYPLKNYKLTIGDFAQHDYIAEYIFLQQSSHRSISESKALTEKLTEQNIALQVASKNIESLSRFPEENPNPVLRFNDKLELIYANHATRFYFGDDFNIDNPLELDQELKSMIVSSIENPDEIIRKIVERNNRHYSVTLCAVAEFNYVNIYVSDITTYLNEVQAKELELKQLTEQLEEQREFYEFILNNIPADIAVFSREHKYIFVNPQGIKNPEIRSFMIGKDDFDYCAYKGIDDSIAIERRRVFDSIMQTRQFINWEDEFTTPNGDRMFVLRRMGPLFDENGEIRYVIGYGIDVTEQKLSEERDNKRTESLIVQKNALVEISQLSSNLNLDDRLLETIKKAANILKCERVSIWYLNEEQNAIASDYIYTLSNNNIIEGATLKSTDYPNYFKGLLTNDGSIIAHEATAHPNTFEFTESYLNPLGITSMLDVPIRIGNKILGVICHEHIGNSRKWQEEEINFVRSIADLVALFIENHQKQLAEESLYAKSIFQNLLIDISTKYINIPVDQIKESIKHSLENIGFYTQVDRVYIFEYNKNNSQLICQYEWCSKELLQNERDGEISPLDIHSAWFAKHQEGEIVFVKDVNKVSDNAIKNWMESRSIKSLISIPLMEENTCIGFIGLDTVHSKRSFTEDEINLLKVYAEMLVHVNTRARYLRELEESKNEIEAINAHLESMVAEKTKKNLELAKSITEQEKLVTIGEISSGIAHDLNTPLGAIKSGAESIRFTLEQLFKDTIAKCTEQQIEMACTRAIDKDPELFIGGLQQIKETQAFVSYLEINYPQINKETQRKLADSFVRSRVGLNEPIIIHQILTCDNPFDFLDLIYHLKMIRTFVDTILKSSEKAAQVVQGLRTFIKEKKDAVKTKVNLHENIATVLNIFNYELKRVCSLEFNVDQSLEIEGFDSKLFQLWSNILKNAIEAMASKNEYGLIRIYSSTTGSSITISIENNGPKIPENIQKHIFTKFFTTKAEQNGTGLGLNIVKNVIEDHNAQIKLSSNDDWTRFNIIFTV